MPYPDSDICLPPATVRKNATKNGRLEISIYTYTTYIYIFNFRPIRSFVRFQMNVGAVQIFKIFEGQQRLQRYQRLQKHSYTIHSNRQHAGTRRKLWI